MAPTWTTKWEWHSEYSADSVEWCPIRSFENVLVCGTYELDQTQDKEKNNQNKQTRVGRINLFTIDRNTEILEPIQTVETSGILDQKWCYHMIQDHPVLAAVTSVGKIQLYRLVKSDCGLRLNLWLEETVGDVLALSVDWSTNKNVSDRPMLAVSDSSGAVTVWSLHEDKLIKLGDWNVHGYEAWIAAFNYWNPDVFYSGGDDCLFKSIDVRVSGGVVSSNRSHEAGVTTIRCHIDIEYQLLTGSYDEKVRLWDTRNLKRAAHDSTVDGGVWRLKWCPHDKDIVLAACMYGGFRLLKMEDSADLTVLCEYMEHESIAYGADFRHDSDWPVVATCSFYDRRLHVSEILL